MNAPRPLVLQTEDLDAEASAWLGERADLVRVVEGSPAWQELLPRAEGLVVRTYTRVDPGLLGRAESLRVVGRAGVGLDNIDVAACRSRGVRVVHTPGANTQAVVEYVLALMLDGLRPRLFLDRPAGSLAAWQSIRRELTAPRQLSELTLGVVGVGRIGSRVAAVAQSLGMRVIGCDLGARPGIEETPLHELCARSDVISVHVDGRASNRGLIGADAFGRMRSDVVFINTSRGFVVEACACAAFMAGHPGACALLDVHEPEPLEAGSPLLGLANVHLSPHIAGATAAAKRAMSWVVRDVWGVLTGHEPAHEARA
jgi:phosphoglycerate dehydrogenase-like enzyme